MSIRRMLPFILVNIVVSAVVVLAILYWWDSREETGPETIDPVTAVTPSPSGLAPAAEAVVSATATPEPEDGPPVHVVKAGETLGTISQLYEVSMDDIVAMNNLANPNVLSVGQELVIPVGGLPTATPPPTAVPTTAVVPDPIATEPIAQGEAAVTITAVIGVGQLENEAVQIQNSGDSPIAMRDWRLVDGEGREYRFGQVTLFNDADLRLYTAAGNDRPNQLYWGLDAPVWTSGETVTLRNANGETQATYEVP